MHGMKKPVEASRATVFASLEPVVAMILGALIFKEPVNAISFIGVAVIVLSIAIMNRE
jgi:drug/metabolite transporter (DMT)-like permease